MHTIMDFSAVEHDVICTRKINIDRGGNYITRLFYYISTVHRFMP